MKSFTRRIALAGASIVIAGVASVSSAIPAGSAQTPGVNGMIQYTAFTATAAGIHLVQPDGTGDMLLIENGVGASFDASGSRLAYVTFSNGSSSNELRYAETDGSGGGVIASTTGTDFIDFVTMSPDGTKVAYVLHTNSNSSTDLFLCNIDGSGLVNLTNGAYDVASPEFSPDGTTIVFESAHGGLTPQLFRLDPSGPSITQLTNSSDELHYVAWKPDASGFIGIAVSGPRSSVVSVSLDGATITTLFDAASVGSGFILWAMISPDGTKLVYSASRVEPAALNDPSSVSGLDLWTSDLDGTNAVMIVPRSDIGALAPGWTTLQPFAPTTTTTTAPTPVTPKITG